MYFVNLFFKINKHLLIFVSLVLLTLSEVCLAKLCPKVIEGQNEYKVSYNLNYPAEVRELTFKYLIEQKKVVTQFNMVSSGWRGVDEFRVLQILTSLSEFTSFDNLTLTEFEPEFIIDKLSHGNLYISEEADRQGALFVVACLKGSIPPFQ